VGSLWFTLMRATEIVSFPDVETADEDGLVMVGGRLTAPWILAAYQRGIFPWPLVDPRGTVLAWFSPDPRGILELNALHVALSTGLLQCGYIAEQRDFLPHITLTRKQTGVQKNSEMEPLVWPVDGFSFDHIKEVLIGKRRHDLFFWFHRCKCGYIFKRKYSS